MTFRVMPGSPQEWYSKEHEIDSYGQKTWKKMALEQHRKEEAQIKKDGLLTAQDLAQKMGVTYATVYTWIKTKKVPVKRLKSNRPVFTLEKVLDALGPDWKPRGRKKEPEAGRNQKCQKTQRSQSRGQP